MSTVEDVPAEVEAMDGVASEEEAHNVDRPARDSGISKHKEGDKPRRVELKDLEIGAEVSAKVKTVTSYGAFLDIEPNLMLLSTSPVFLMTSYPTLKML